jgi:hypothetical protein
MITGTALALAMLAAGPAQAEITAKPTRLKDGVEQSHPTPPPTGHMYKYTTSSSSWSVIGIDSPSSIDVDLRLYGDKGEDELVGTSFASAGVADFIAVDSHHRALDTYFPRVDSVSGTGGYDVQLAQGTVTLGTVPQKVAMLDDQIFVVRDTFMEAGKTYRFTLTPGSSLMDADVFLMDSLPLTSGTWVKSRSQAMRVGTAAAGQPVVMEVVAPRSDWYGLVISRQGVVGTYDLVRTTL